MFSAMPVHDAHDATHHQGAHAALAHVIELTPWSRRLGEDAYDCAVGRDAFFAIMARAARHKLRVVSSRRFKAWHVRDLVLEAPDREGTAGPPLPFQGLPGRPGPDQHRRPPVPTLHRERLVWWREAEEGTPLLLSCSERARLSFAAFPCGARTHEDRYVSRLVLGVRDAALPSTVRLALVMEQYRSGAAGALVHRASVTATVEAGAPPADSEAALRAATAAAERLLLGRKRIGNAV